MDKRIKLNKYEQVTLKALDKIIINNELPEIAWNNAVKEIFGIKAYGGNKSCPKNSFLGLCEEEKIKGLIHVVVTVTVSLQKDIDLHDTIFQRFVFESLHVHCMSVHTKRTNLV